MQIIYSSKFQRQYKKLPKEVKDFAKKKEKTFKKDPFDKSLKTHKLSGKLSEFWAFSISRSHRIIFELASEDTVHFLFVGSHDIYR